MATDCKIQINFKHGVPDLINVYANTEEETITLLQSLANPIVAAAIADAQQELTHAVGVATVTSAFPGATQVVPVTGNPSCVHGQRVRKEGRSAKGPWGAWFCPQSSGQKCEPMWDEKK